ncbi:unnamed protein product [Cuscuta campestris]|uniref:Uncharacterized protein n=1 Tax=Cuscuta campestris TaxID=132261 RepID=A0A484MU56_9ASTE|nr:unnamed protein product [Cuscuta campestris]
MKIFNWIHGKIHGKQPVVVNKPHPNNTTPYTAKEEFSDWPNSLLAIGTFGNNKNQLRATEASSPDCGGGDGDRRLTGEEVGELKKELKLLMHKHSVRENGGLEKFFDCLDDIEEEGIVTSPEDEDVLCGGGRTAAKTESSLSSSSSIITRKSLSFLFKKAILCRGGFIPPPAPSLPLPSDLFPADGARSEKSRMDRILKSILNKKIYPQGAANPRTSTKKYQLEDNNLYLCENYSESEDEEDDEDEEDGEGVGKAGGEQGRSKWVKTDSDFIVLEI